MAVDYVTRAADSLDLICERQYGVQAGAVERVLEVNPHIAAVAHRLPVGVSIQLPDIGATAHAKPALRLWD